MESTPFRSAAMTAVPLPANRSRQTSPGLEMIAHGDPLVDDLRVRAREAQVRRERLRSELALAEAEHTALDPDLLPATVQEYVDSLGGLLERGQVGPVKSALSRLTTRITAYEAPALGNGRPGARLKFWGNLEGVIDLAGSKVKIGNSPGGIRTLVVARMPERARRLRGRGLREAA